MVKGKDFMFEFSKRNSEENKLKEECDRINRITDEHSEKISDCAILINIVNNEDAKKLLSADKFAEYMDKFNEIASRREQLETNLLQYQHRTFNIAYEIEWETGIPYEDICGDSTDILYMYSNMKPGFDDLVEQAISEYSDIVEDIIRKNPDNTNERLCFRNWVYGIQYYVQASSMVIAPYESLKTDYFTSYAIQVIYGKMGERVIMHYLKNESDEPVIQSWNRKIADLGLEAINNNNVLEDALDRFTNSFLYLCGVPQDVEDKDRLLKIMNDLQKLGKS